MQAVEILKNEHRMIDDLLVAVQKTPDHNVRRELMVQVGIVVSRHFDLEENVLYPVCARYMSLRGLIERSLDTHQLISDLIVQMSEERSMSELDGLYDQLVETVARHIDEEETELFSRLAETFDDTATAELSWRFDQAVASSKQAA